jgi:hypothetical protein
MGDIKELVERLSEPDGPDGPHMDRPLFYEVMKACGIKPNWGDRRLDYLMKFIRAEAWRDACAELQAVALPGWDGRTVAVNPPDGCAVRLSKLSSYQSVEGTHPTSEPRAHLIAILRAMEAAAFRESDKT